MSQLTAEHWAAQKCVPCEGGIAPCTMPEAQERLAALPHWRLTHNARRIRRDWIARDFLAGMRFFDAVATLAEAEQHHPDLHLEGYRNVWIEISTHAIDGLSDNDFILAAKIDQLPIELKKRPS